MVWDSSSLHYMANSILIIGQCTALFVTGTDIFGDCTGLYFPLVASPRAAHNFTNLNLKC